MSLSIVIPAYNEAKYLPTLLCSLKYAERSLEDAYPDYPIEIIVVDNDSNDETKEIALSYSAQVVRESRRNVAAARNHGASVATGEYLVFVDADYRVEGDFMTGIASAFTTAPKTVALGVNVVVEENDLDILQRTAADFGLSLLRKIMQMSFGVFAFRRAYFEHLGGFDERFFAYEDVELFGKLKSDLRNGTLRYRILDGVRVHASGRGFHRGGMYATYFRMFISRRSRQDPKYCAYWYERHD